MTKEQLKAEAYDIIITTEQLQARLRSINVELQKPDVKPEPALENENTQDEPEIVEQPV